MEGAAGKEPMKRDISLLGEGGSKGGGSYSHESKQVFGFETGPGAWLSARWTDVDRRQNLLGYMNFVIF